ncbi:MAG: hypothetical protein RR342_03315 [Bacilli bacterium]
MKKRLKLSVLLFTMFPTLVSCNHNIDYSLYETAYGIKGTELYFGK